MNICDSMWVSLPEQHVGLTAGEYKIHIAKMLYTRTEKGLDIFLRILAYLLELVESHDARTVSLLKTAQDTGISPSAYIQDGICLQALS